MISRLAKKLSLIKADKINNHCKKFLGKKVLDVGAGRCYIAKTITEKNNVEVTCVDVIDKNKTNINLVVYDGVKIPFNDNTFDSVLLVYVLHHCKDQETLLNECLRVSKGNVIIFEDAEPTLFTKFMDYSFNTLRGVKAPLCFRKIEAWKKLFNTVNAEVIHIERDVEKEWFYPFVEHTMFVIKKRSNK